MVDRQVNLIQRLEGKLGSPAARSERAKVWASMLERIENQ